MVTLVRRGGAETHSQGKSGASVEEQISRSGATVLLLLPPANIEVRLLKQLSALRTDATLRIWLVLAVLVSWFAFSNRCALGQLLSSGRTVAVQHGCCEQKAPQPGKAPSDPNSQECCKAFHALNNSPAKMPPVVEAAMLAVVPVFQFEIPSPEACFPSRAETGPPDTSSFVELVLHRSLRSHAPPVRA